MADKAISELVAASAISASDLFVLEQNATAKKLTGQILINYLTAAADGHGGVSRIAKTGTAGLVDTYTITYADTSTSTFTVTNGAKGNTGQAYYVWIRYSAAQPTTNSDMGNTPDNWMGIYTGTSSTAPTAYTSYAWFQIKGAKGDTGAAAYITGRTITYQASSSGTEVPIGTWQSTIPAVTQGNYLWTRTVIIFNNNTSITSYSVGRMGVDGDGSPSSTTPKAPGTAAAGSETAYARGDHVHPKELTDGAVTASKLGSGSVSAVYFATVGTTWVGSAAPYSQAIEVTGLLATDRPIIDVSGLTAASAETAEDEWAKVYKAVATADTLTLYTLEKTTASFGIQMMVVRK